MFTTPGPGPAVALALLAATLTGCAATPTATAQEAETMPEWEQQADARIAKHRMGGFTVRVVDKDGEPVEGAEVAAEMTRHAFPFGTTMRADVMARLESEDDPYLTWAAKLFNHGTFGNRLKWRWQERAKHRAMADAGLEWMKDRGWTVHAHVMIWATQKYGPPMPPDVARKLKSDDPDRGEYARRRSLEHIAEIGRYYRGRVEEWDVVNEHFSEHVISEALYGDDVPLEESPILVEWLETAREADPHAKLYVNDFGILVGDQKAHKDSYERMIRFLLDQDAPVDGIGVQAHYVNGWQRRSPEQLMKTLDRFADTGLTIQITEFDMWGKGWGETEEEIDAAQAEFMRQFYITCFSHPAVDGITMWGFWDGRHWMDNAPLFNEDWSPKRGFDVYQNLVFDRWWTEEQGVTDADGEMQFRGIFGQYRLAATAGEQRVEREVALEADGQGITLVIDR